MLTNEYQAIERVSKLIPSTPMELVVVNMNQDNGYTLKDVIAVFTFPSDLRC